MKKSSGFSVWTARESVLALLYVLGAIAIGVGAHAHNVPALGILGYLLLFAAGVIVVWSFGRGPERRSRNSERK